MTSTSNVPADERAASTAALSEARAKIERARRVQALAPFFDQVPATGYLPSIFPASTEDVRVSVGDVLRQQYVSLGGRLTFDFETLERIGEIVRALEGQVVDATSITLPPQHGLTEDERLMRETERELMGEVLARGAEEQSAPEAG